MSDPEHIEICEAFLFYKMEKEEKTCNTCHNSLELRWFATNNNRPYGVADKCKECTRQKLEALPILSGEIRECSVCKLELDLINFQFRKDRGYYEKRCRTCKKAKEVIEDTIYIGNQKRCPNCLLYKNFEEFNSCSNCAKGLSSSCKECACDISKKYRDSLDPQIKRKRRQEEYIKNREGYLRRSSEYQLNNKEKIRDSNKLRGRNLKFTNPLLNLKRNISTLIRMTFRGNYKKGKKCVDILGCSIEEFKNHIESQFLNWMTWENKGNACEELMYNCSWDLDHIIPVSYAKTEEEVYLLNHWSNFQPMCSKVNRWEKRDFIPLITNLELNITTYE